MHRVDTASAVLVQPDPEAAGTPGHFSKGDPVGGVPATAPGQDWFEAVQEELIAILTAFGVSPDTTKADYGQIATALLANLANISGNASQAFKVSAAAASNEAVNLGQFVSSLVANGYVQLPGGLIIQWGTTAAVTSNSTLVVTFPIAFPTQCFSILAGGTSNTVSASVAQQTAMNVVALTVASFTLANDDFSQTARWFALGY